jgi:hypothetical protein
VSVTLVTELQDMDHDSAWLRPSSRLCSTFIDVLLVYPYDSGVVESPAYITTFSRLQRGLPCLIFLPFLTSLKALDIAYRPFLERSRLQVSNKEGLFVFAALILNDRFIPRGSHSIRPLEVCALSLCIRYKALPHFYVYC